VELHGCEARSPLFRRNLCQGDILKYDPGADVPVLVFRLLTAEDGQAVWLAIQAGAITRVSDDAPVVPLADAPAPALPAPADAVSRRQALRVIRGAG